MEHSMSVEDGDEATPAETPTPPPEATIRGAGGPAEGGQGGRPPPLALPGRSGGAVEDEARQDRLEQLAALQAAASFDDLGAETPPEEPVTPPPAIARARIRLAATAADGTDSDDLAAKEEDANASRRVGRAEGAGADLTSVGGSAGGSPVLSWERSKARFLRQVESAWRVQDAARDLAERPVWTAAAGAAGAAGATPPPPADQDGWRGNHGTLFSNEGLHPNKRSYFDRWLDPMSPLGALKPKWRLEPDAPTEEAREAAASAWRSWSPQGARAPKVSKGAEPAAVRRRRRLPQEGQERPWESPPLPLSEDAEARRPGPGGGGCGGCGDGRARVEGGDGAVDPFFSPGSQGARAAKGVGSWDGHHHILWCNEELVGRYDKLNPMQFRSYFDRWRNPDVGARSAELRPMRSDGKATVVSRIVPVWRLEPMKGMCFPTPEDLRVEPQALAPRSGTGGSPISTHARHGPPPPEPLGAARRRGWISRHDVATKNEEAQGFVHVCSLARSCSPQESAEAVCASGDERFSPDGKWNARHHLTFDNRIHQNARSYFERWREPADTACPARLLGPSAAAGAEAEAGGDGEGSSEPAWPPCQDPTVGADCKRRDKLREEERLQVQWSLQESPGPKDPRALAVTLRHCDSDPGLRPPRGRRAQEHAMLQGRQKGRRRAGWFSSHDVVF